MNKLREAQATLAATKDRLQRVLDSITEGYYVLDSEWRFVVMNAAAVHHFEVCATDLIGKNFWEATAIPRDSLVYRKYHEAVAGNYPIHFENHSIVRPGSWWDLYLCPQNGGLEVYFHDISDRKRAEHALRENEAVLRSFFDSPGVIRGIVEIIDGTIVHISCNAAVAEIFGFAPEEISSGKTCRELGASEEVLRFWGDLYERSRREGKSVTDEHVLRDRMGQTHWFLATVSYLGIGKSGHPRFAYNAFDITKRKLAEEKLRASEERFRALVTASSDAIYRVNADWSEMRQLRGFSFLAETETPNPDWLVKYIHPDDRAHIMDVIGEAIRNKSLYELEHRVIRRDGTLGWTQSRAIPLQNENGEIVEWLGTTKNVTERRQAQEALAASESRFRALLDSASQGVVAVDESGCMVLVNARTEEMFGYTRDRLLGQPMNILLPERYRTAHSAHLRDYFAHPRTPAMGTRPDLCGVTREGNEFPLEISLSRIEQGGSRLGMALLTDITDRRKAESRLREAQKRESIAVLAGGVAHDFNNLLVGVIGNASLAKDMILHDHPAAQLLDEVLTCGEQAASLTRQLLAYSGKASFIMEPLNLSALIPEFCGLVRPSIPKEITFSLEMAEHLPAVEADRGQMQQVFMNLALNAAEAIGSAEGAITVSTGVREADPHQFRTEAAPASPAKYVFLEVRDTGAGMDETTKAKIFDPFFTTKFVGRGLGLAAVAGIVRGHKGGIIVTSEPDRGTCFTVLLPLSPRPARSNPPLRRASAPHGAGTILVVDDEPVIREVARRALEAHGYSVLLADGASTAIDMLRRYPGEIALVVLDLSMPDMSGQEALPQLARIRPGVRVIVSSGYSETEVLGLFEGQRVAGFIQKPYTATGIAEKVRKSLVQ